MKLSDFYIKHFSDLCCYEDYLMRIDLMGRKHNNEEVLGFLPLCDEHRFIVAGGEVIWIGDNGEKVDNPNITSISDHAFAYCDEIQKIVIPNNVTSIGRYAFYNCNGIKSVTIPNSVTSIGSYAFDSCRGLTSVAIPSSVMIIGQKAFSNCSGLESVTIPSSVISIGTSAFDGYLGTKLKSVKVPKECQIGKFAFPYGCAVQYY